MKTYSAKSCLLAALLLGVAVGCSRQKAAITSLEGHWAGYDASPPNARCEITITRNQMDYHGSQSNDWCRGVFVLNEQAQPKELDLTIEESPQNVGETALAIYEQQGDDLKVAVAPPGEIQRPADFTASQNVRVIMFKRQ